MVPRFKKPQSFSQLVNDHPIINKKKAKKNISKRVSNSAVGNKKSVGIKEPVTVIGLQPMIKKHGEALRKTGLNALIANRADTPPTPKQLPAPPHF